MRPKLIVRLSGGLGNQMFGYAAARRLAIKTGAELVVDPWSGFVRDTVYGRRFALGPFAIAARMATTSEMLRPFERARRALLKRREARKPYDARRYVVQDEDAFEARLLTKPVMGTTFIEGVWPSEDYFLDVACQVRADFALKAMPHGRVEVLGQQMKNSNSVAVHVRFFKTDSTDTSSNVGADYYTRSLAMIRERVVPAHFYVFSDRPADAAQKLGLATDEATLVDHNGGDLVAHHDLWLMSQCRHIVIANSTFSWWGAWLGDTGGDGRMVIAPDPARYPAMGWSLERFLPDRWLKV